MTRTFGIGLLALAVSGPVGCRYFDTNRSLRGTPSPDSPVYLDRSIEAQEKRGRARFGIFEDDFRIGPKGYIDRPDPIMGGVEGGVAGPR